MGFKPERVYEAYWIREPHHTSVATEGYVGITCKGVERRFNEHCWSAEKGEGWTLQQKIRDIGRENLAVSAICIGSFEYIKDLELRLRPYPYIGWNHAKGGGGHTPEFASERQKRTAKKFKGTEQEALRIERYKESMSAYYTDPDFIKRRSKSLKKSWEGNEERREATSERAKANWEDPVLREQMTKSIRDRTSSPEYKEKMSIVQTERWENASEEDRERHRKGASEAAKKRYSENPFWKHPSANLETVSLADKAYEIWFSTKRCGHRRIEEVLGFKEYAFDHMVRRFRKGWNPLEDEEWIEDFKNG